MKPSRHARRRTHALPAGGDYAAYGLVRAAAALVNIAGPEASSRFLRDMGGLFARMPFNRRRLSRAEENIAWCFPEWDRQRVRAQSVEAYRHLFCLAGEVALTTRFLTVDAIHARVALADLGGGLRALSGDRPCILITGHCGNWELLGYALALLGFPMHALYRPLDLAPMDAWLHETRSRKGLELVDKFGAADVLPRLLERRRSVGFIADQNAGDRGLFVPFFNRLASTYKTIGLLAMRFGASIVCGHARRVGTGLGDEPLGAYRYRLEIVDSFGASDWHDQPDPLFYITARYRRAIETMVRRSPEQYLWMHRYWKSRPPHERKGRPFPAQLREKIASLPWIDPDDVEQIVHRSARDTAELHMARR